MVETDQGALREPGFLTFKDKPWRADVVLVGGTVSYVIRRFIASLAGRGLSVRLDLRWDTALRDFQAPAEALRPHLVRTLLGSRGRNFLNQRKGRSHDLKH